MEKYVIRDPVATYSGTKISTHKQTTQNILSSHRINDWKFRVSENERYSHHIKGKSSHGREEGRA